jgi:hypothetical protein
MVYGTDEPRVSAQCQQAAGSRRTAEEREMSSSPGRRYRVTKGFRWIEGGRPGPLQWEGGESVAYEPGDTVYVEDRELPGIDSYLEAIDDDGRAALEQVRAKAEAPPQFTAVADIDRSTCGWALALDERHRRAREEGRIETTYTEHRDGTTTLLSTKVYPANPLPDVVYDDNGLPLPYDTARQRKRAEMERTRAEMERTRAEMERTLAAVRAGAKEGGKRARATRRDEAARRDEDLLTAVQAERKKHPSHGRPAIAEALLSTHGRPIDHADPMDRKRAVAALTKRIERLEKRSLDR